MQSQQNQEITKPVLVDKESITRTKMKDGSIKYSVWYIDYDGYLYFINRTSRKAVLNEIERLKWNKTIHKELNVKELQDVWDISDP